MSDADKCEKLCYEFLKSKAGQDAIDAKRKELLVESNGNAEIALCSASIQLVQAEFVANTVTAMCNKMVADAAGRN